MGDPSCAAVWAAADAGVTRHRLSASAAPPPPKPPKHANTCARAEWRSTNLARASKLPHLTAVDRYQFLESLPWAYRCEFPDCGGSDGGYSSANKRSVTPELVFAGQCCFCLPSSEETGSARDKIEVPHRVEGMPSLSEHVFFTSDSSSRGQVENDSAQMRLKLWLVHHRPHSLCHGEDANAAGAASIANAARHSASDRGTPTSQLLAVFGGSKDCFGRTFLLDHSQCTRLQMYSGGYMNNVQV